MLHICFKKKKGGGENMEIFKRNYSFEIRANEDKENKNYTLTGRPIVYNSKKKPTSDILTNVSKLEH